MTSDKLQEASTPLYIYDGAEAPLDYRALSNGIDAVEMADPITAIPGYWERHFQNAANTEPHKFDWVFGVIMPVICFAADPIVFKSWFEPGDAMLSAYKPFAYLLSFMSIMAMLAWLIWGEQLKGLSVLVSGILAAGALVSLLIGFLLVPFSLFGLLILIGILGFTPFFTFAAFWRTSRRAFVAAKPYFESGLLARVFGLTAFSALVIPMVVNAAIGKNIVARLIELLTR